MLQQAYAALHLDKQAQEIAQVLANSKQKEFPELENRNRVRMLNRR